ncbi:alpha/beta family hydrolase [Paremcibacter congregatus]|uniref:alpha/beta family hydrolase n=1 Tax=Paremcibacter congregatus TaxID=2043170 RepID=UPI003A95046B
MTEDIKLPCVWNGPEMASKILILAHGAGAPMDSPFMDYFATQLGDRGIRVLRFEFPYMAERRTTGKKRPPDRQPKLLTSWRQMIDDLDGTEADIYIGGKSMGGRMASLIADECFLAGRIRGLVCLGYPFYAPGKSDRPRTEHLQDIACPTLILQGERDAMGNRDTVVDYDLSDNIIFQWAPDGNHDLSPRKRSAYTEHGNWNQAIEGILTFMTSS